jgi:hypothetical protein
MVVVRKGVGVHNVILVLCWMRLLVCSVDL